MLSQTAEYALRAAVWLAQHSDRPQTTQEIAAGMQVPAMYLSKVMQLLVRGGTVHAQRGRSGGFILVKPAGQVSLYEVIHAVDPFRRITKCPLGLARHCKQLCPLHTKLDRSLEAIENDFKSTFLADLVEPRQIGAATHA